MDHILSFFSDLILFTAGLVVVSLWLVLLLIVADEIIDLFVEWRSGKNDESEEDSHE